MENIPKYYKIYTDYKNNGMLPSIIDGLLPVQRRLLLTLHLTAQSYVKTAKVLGELMGRFHPHGIANTVTVWAVQNEFADGDGQWGTQIGIEPIGASSYRYTKIKSNKNVEDFAFKYIKAVPWLESEIDNEPKYLPSMFPFCLLGSNMGGGYSRIGSGFKTEIPIYKKQDLYKRLLYLIGELKTEPIIEPSIYNCKITSSKKELKEILTKGVGNVSINGTITEDRKNLRIFLHGWNPKVTFQTLLNKINNYNKLNLLTNGLIGFIDESTGSVGTKIRFEVSKQRNLESIYDTMLEAIKNAIYDKISYSIFIIDKDNNVRLASIDEMLLEAYNNFKQACKQHCENCINYFENQIIEYDYIEKIKPYLSECLNLKTEIEIIQQLSKKSKISEENIKTIIEKYKIKKLITLNTDKINLQNEINNIKTKLNNLNNYIIEQYSEII